MTYTTDKVTKKLTRKYLKKDSDDVIYLNGYVYMLGIIGRDAVWQAQINAIKNARDEKLCGANGLEKDKILTESQEQINELTGKRTIVGAWEMGTSYKECKQWLIGFLASLDIRDRDEQASCFKYRETDSLLSVTPPQVLIDSINGSD